MTWTVRLVGWGTTLIVLLLLSFAAGADSWDAVAPVDTGDGTTTDSTVAPSDSWVGIWVGPDDSWVVSP
jgi:hypothetical protein